MRFDRRGRAAELSPKLTEHYGLRLSPDGRRLASFVFSPVNSAQEDIEVYDLERGTASRLTTNGISEWPIWSPDGRRVLFSFNAGIDAVSADGEGARDTVVKGPGRTTPDDWTAPMEWSRDGKWLAYLAAAVGKRQIWVRPMAERGEPHVFYESRFALTDACFSPDGKWIAYTSDETGPQEVYVQAFPGPGGKHRISPAGGCNPAWNPNGRELFYLLETQREGKFVNQVMAVDLDTNGPFHAGIPRTLFGFKEGQVVETSPTRSYDVYPDGDHFIAQPLEYDPGPPVKSLHVVANWSSELRRRVRSGR
jgi:Tol biopolymer transport system component